VKGALKRTDTHLRRAAASHAEKDRKKDRGEERERERAMKRWKG
jgi:hypothetical protein